MSDRVFGIIFLIISLFTVPMLEGDATFLVFAIPVSMALIFQKIPGGNRGKNREYNEEHYKRR